MTHLAGIVTAIPTPLDARGAVDARAVAQLVEHQIAAGITGIVPLGGTGEFTALSHAQRCAMVEATVEACAGRVPVIPGVLAPGLADAIAAATAFTAAGADALMVVTPYYYRPTQSGIVDYFKHLADRVDNDIVLYEIPYRTGVALTAETVGALADMTRIIGMKACNRDLDQQMTVVRDAGNRIAVLTGEEDVFPLHIAMGAVGGILATSNLVPRAWNTVLMHASRGDLEHALELHARLRPVIDVLFAEPNPAPIKAALRHFYGFPDGVLPPLLPASDPLRRRIAEVLTPFVNAEQATKEPQAQHRKIATS
jgi:4-hydroxy-tetrahydrodipicolinate synthase